MLAPENWLEYEWRTVTNAVLGKFLVDPMWRLWRITIQVASTGTDTSIVIGDPLLSIPFYTATGLAGSTLILEPKGMFPAIVESVSGTDFLITVEQIRRFSA